MKLFTWYRQQLYKYGVTSRVYTVNERARALRVFRENYTADTTTDNDNETLTFIINGIERMILNPNYRPTTTTTRTNVTQRINTRKHNKDIARADFGTFDDIYRFDRARQILTAETLHAIIHNDDNNGYSIPDDVKTAREYGHLNDKDYSYIEKPFPVLNAIIANGTDKAIVTHALKSLESKGNESARKLLYDSIIRQGLNVEYDDLLQELRLTLCDLEASNMIDFDDVTNRIIVNDDETTVYKRIYSSVTGYLYKHHSIPTKKHVSIMTADGEYIDMFDRLSWVIRSNIDRLLANDTVIDFTSYIYNTCTDNRARELTRTMYLLMDNLTLKEIAKKLHIDYRTLTRRREELKRLYYECFMYNDDENKRPVTVRELMKNSF